MFLGCGSLDEERNSRGPSMWCVSVVIRSVRHTQREFVPYGIPSHTQVVYHRSTRNRQHLGNQVVFRRCENASCLYRWEVFAEAVLSCATRAGSVAVGNPGARSDVGDASAPPAKRLPRFRAVQDGIVV